MSQGSKICRKCHGTLEVVLKLGRRIHRGGQNTAVIDCPDCRPQDQIAFMAQNNPKQSVECTDCSDRGTIEVEMGGVRTEIECACQFPPVFRPMLDRSVQREVNI